MTYRHRITLSDEELADFCRRWKVRELSLFGSVIREDFRDDSDIDILVSFLPGSGWSLFDFAGMQLELEDRLGRKVDLVQKEALRNPYRRHGILTRREVVYAA